MQYLQCFLSFSVLCVAICHPQGQGEALCTVTARMTWTGLRVPMRRSLEMKTAGRATRSVFHAKRPRGSGICLGLTAAASSVKGLLLENLQPGCRSTDALSADFWGKWSDPCGFMSSLASLHQQSNNTCLESEGKENSCHLSSSNNHIGTQCQWNLFIF